MRVNIYSQELITDRTPDTVVELIQQTSNTGIVYSAVRMFLHSSDKLHHPPADDDRSALTVWLPKSSWRREMVAASLEAMAGLIRSAPPETGVD